MMVHCMPILGVSVGGTIVPNITKYVTNFDIDIFPAFSRMHISNKDTPHHLMKTAGVITLFSACEQARTCSDMVQKEAFRSMLIDSLAGLNFHMKVLCKIGMLAVYGIKLCLISRRIIRTTSGDATARS